MSAQSGKKKRIGSRRRVANQNKTSEADEFQVTDSASVAQPFISEVNCESLNEFDNSNNSQSETQKTPSPELPVNRRKLGCSRRNKGQHVKESELYLNSREKVEEQTRGNETEKTIQPQRQEELSKETESATHDSSVLANTPDYSSEIRNSTTTNSPDVNLESFIPKSKNLLADKDEISTDDKVVSDSFNFVETKHGGTDKTDTLQSEELIENAETFGISELTTSVTVTEDEKRDKGQELLKQDGNLQGNYVVSESHLKSEDVEFSTTAEVTTDKSSPRENIGLEHVVGQEAFSSSNEKLQIDEEKKEDFNVSEVKVAQHLEDAVNKVHKQEANPTEMHEINHSPERVTQGENYDVISVYLTDKAEVSNTNQSESMVESADDSATKQEDSDDKQDEHPTKQDDFKALEQTNEHTKIPQIGGIEQVDNALGQVNEVECQVGDDVIPSAEQTVHQEKEGLVSEKEESDSSSQTLPSETHAPLDSHPQQNVTDSHPLGSRRKLGSSRRHKGRQHAKDSVAESYHEEKDKVVESITSKEALETTHMLVVLERTSQEEFSQRSENDIVMPTTHDSSLNADIMLDYSSEVQNLNTSNCPKTDLESLAPKSENLQEDNYERESDIKVSFESVEDRLEEMDKLDTLQSQEIRVAQHSEDIGNKVHEQEVSLTQMDEIDHSSESVTLNATEKSERISDNLIDQAEDSDTNQSELIVESTDDSATKQEDSDDKQEEHPIKQDDFMALEQTNEDAKIRQISGIEQVDNALGQVYEVEGQVGDDMIPSAEQTVHQEKEGLISEMEESDSSAQTLQSEIHSPFDSQPQQNDTDSHPLGSRRKLGSSRRHKGRQHAKDSAAESYHEEKDEVTESIRSKEALETTQMLAAIERTSQEEFSQGSENDVVMPTTHDSSLYADIMLDYSSEVQDLNTSNYPKTDLESFAPESENLQEDNYERESDIKVSVESVGDRLEEMDKLDTLQSQEVRAAQHSEDVGNKVHEQEVNLTQMHEIDHSSESVTLNATEKSEKISDNLIDQAEVIDTNQSELIVESTDDSATKQEDSNLDDKQGVHPAKEDNLEPSEQTNEDRNVYDTKQIQINDIESVDTALAQVYEIEGRVEDDVKPSAEPSVLQEKEGQSSEDEEDRSLQTLPSELYPPSDSQPQESDTNFKPIGNRRKLGCSRRIKGRQHAKDSVAESYHRPTEEVVGHLGDNESIETTKMSFTTETAVQEKSVETIQEGIDTGDTSQTEEVKQYAHIGITELTASSLLLSTAGQQLIDQSNSMEIPEELPSVYSVTEKESKDGDKYTESLRQDGNLQDNYLVKESFLKLEDIEYSMRGIAKANDSSREHTEPQYSVEQAIVSSPKEELSTHEETIEHFSLHEVKVVQHADNVVHKVHEQEVKPTEIHEIVYHSDNVTHDATEKSEIISGNLIDKAEVSNTNQSEWMLESTDDSATKQEDSNPDDQQGIHPAKEDNLEASEQTNEHPKIPQISGIEQVDSALGQVYEVEGQVGDDMIPSAEQTGHQKKEGPFSEMEESDSSAQTLPSEIHAPFDSKPQQNDTDSHPLASRRKLGSSRRHKGQQHAKDSVAESYHEEKDEVVESITGKEALETTQMLAAIERTSQEEFSQGSENDIVMPTSHDSSLYADIMPDYFSEVQNLNTSNYSEADLKTLAPKSENLQEDQFERESDIKVSFESLGDRQEEMDKLDTLHSQEIRVAQHSEDVGNEVHEQEVNLTQMQEIDHSSESITLDATEKSEIISDNLIDKAEDSDANQSELMVESADDSATKQEDSDDKQDEHPTKQDDFVALGQTNEDAKIPQISGIEQVDNALGQVYEVEGQVGDDMIPSAEQTVHQELEGLISEMEESDSFAQTLPSEIHAPLDSHPQQNDTDSHPLGSRRKLGSSRRHKGRQHAKDSVAESYHEEKDEAVESITGKEALETTQMLAAIERTSQEEFSQGSENDIVMPTTHDSSLYADVMPDYSSEVQNLNTSNYSEADLKTLAPKSENLQEDQYERESDIKVSFESLGDRQEEMDKLDTLHSQEIRVAQHSEDVGNEVHEQEVNLTQMQEIDHSSESVTLDATEKSEIISDNLIDKAEDSDANQSELMVESADDSATKQEDSDDKQDEHPTKQDDFVALGQTNEDAKIPQISGIEQVDNALGQVYEVEGQVGDDMIPSAEQTVHQELEGLISEMEESDSFAQTLPSEIHAPLDSHPQQNDTDSHPLGSRRKLGSSRRHKGRQHAKDSVAESYHEEKDEAVESITGKEALETTQMLAAIERTSQEEFSQGSENDIVMPTTHDSSLYADIMPDYSSEVQNLSTSNYSEADLKTLAPKSENLQEDQYERESDIKVSFESLGDRQEEMDKLDTLHSQEIRVAQHSEDVGNEVHEQEVNLTQMQEIDHSSESVTLDATEKSEINSDNLIDKAEDSDANQSELMVESADDSATKQEDSDDKQDEHPTKQDDFVALGQTNEDAKIPQISGIEQVDNALGQVYEVEGQVGGDMIPSAEQTVHQELEGLISEMEESDSFAQTLPSEIHAPLDSHPQQNDTDSHPLGSRRKLGSSRRHKGRQHAKDSVAESYHEEKDEDVESITGKEALETTQMLAAIERTIQEEFSQGSENDIVMPTTHDSSLYADIMPDYSSEVQNLSTSNYSEADLKTLAPKSENLQEDNHERESDFKVSVESVGDRLEEMDKLDTLQSQEIRAAQHSEDVGNKVHEQEVNLTQMHETDHSSESVTLNATEKSEKISDNPIDQAEDSHTNQSELIVESTDDSATKQEDSNPDDKQDIHPAKEDNLEASEQTNEDCNVYDTKQIHINDIESVDTALAQVYEIEGRVEDDVKPSAEPSVLQEKVRQSSEDEEDRSLQTLPSELYPPSDSQPQESDTNFKPIGNRRKLGSSRRIKGRQHAKDSVAESYHRPTEEVVGHPRDNESIETTKMYFTTETAVQEKSVETIQEEIDTGDTPQTEDINDQVKENAAVGIFEHIASSLHSSATLDELLVNQTNSMKMPEEERPNLHSATERKSKHEDNDTELLGQNEKMENGLFRESHLKSEGADSSVTLEKDIEQHSLGEHTDIKCSVEQASFSSSKDIHEAQKEHVNLSQVRGSPQSEGAVNEVHEGLVQLKQVQEMYQIGFSSIEESESLQTLQSGTNAPLDTQHQDNYLSREEQTLTGIKTTGNRRKLGSSRRNKGRQQVEKSVAESYHEHKEDVETRRSDGVLDPTKTSLAVETAKQEEVQRQADLDFRSVPKIRKIRSTLKDEDSTEIMLEKDTVFSQKIIDNSSNVTTNVASSSSKDDKSNKDYNEEEKNVTKEPENLVVFTGHDTVKADLIQSPEDDSDIQNISYHDDCVTTRPITLDVLEQEDMNMQQTNGATETVGDVTIKDYNTEAESSMDVHVFGERFEDPTKKDQEMNASPEFTHAEPFAAVQNKTETSTLSGHKENFRGEPAVDVSEEGRISTEVGVSDSQQGIKEKTELDNSGNLQGKSKQKRRKLGSTRRTQLSRKPEECMDNNDETKDRDDMRNLDEMEVVEELPLSVTAEVSKDENTNPSLSTASKEEQEAAKTAAVPDKGQKLQSNNVGLQIIQSNMISDIDYSKARLPEQLASNNEVVNPIKFAHAADIRDSERNVDNVEASQVDDFTVSEMHVTSVSTQSDIERPESVNVIQDQALESAEASAMAVADLEIVKSVVRGEVGEEQKHAQASVQDLKEVNEEAQNKNLEMRSTSPHRRRKMGSTRRNLGSRSKREDLHEKQDVDDEATATNGEDVKTECFQSIKEKEEPQLETDDKDSENVKSHFRPPSEQTFEENPVSHGQVVETEHQLTPSYLPVMPSTSPKPDEMSEAAGGRRRKMGSSRKSRGRQSQTPGQDRVTDTQNGGDLASIIDEGVIKTAEEESFGLDKISEVDESAKKPSSNISNSKAGEHLKPVSEKTPAHVTTVQHPYAEIRLSQESQQSLSLGSSTGAAFRSNRYNVLMVGDSSVGKTSYIKRAQSGKFSLDLPASVGIDSFMWTVVVDGKPVVLQLWDTAGQERFHSITRQIFHKAQAFLLMYDITSSQSFSAVSYWANCIQEGAAEDVTILLLGNKSDHAKRQIKFQEGEVLAKEYNYEFMECSAATGENVIQSLETVARMLSQKVEPREETTVLHKEPQQKKSSGCC
ncbi:uncharacterized protein LOC115582826 isoform X2 [Sparus aurata]|uniref:uncharacterized protein LOC115582826 isoform X2 n=1 Tax=Sparus aurata TaxID=8175 RepID=UPI0011C1C5CF|nr:uncharacterized protein LOC115582826 isoform X2 [Sparus aurata]